MFLILSISSLTVIICSALMILAWLLSKKDHFRPGKIITIRVWIWSKGICSYPFFFTILSDRGYFLIFDVEITLLLPMIYIMDLSDIISWSWTGLLLLLILLFGLYLEWHAGALEWSD